MKRLALILIVCFVSSCSKKKVVQSTDTGLDYYPLREGRYSVFEVDSTVYTEIPRDTVHFQYQVKEILSDTFVASDGKVMWRLERFIRMPLQPGNYENVAWKPKDVWLVEADDKRVVVAEENKRFTRLIFPVVAGSSWKGDAFSGEGKIDCKYEYVDQPQQFGSIYFERSLSVSQRELRTLISYEKQKEEYARGAGLIFKEHRELYSNSIVPGLAVESRIEHGVIFTQTLVAYGYE